MVPVNHDYPASPSSSHVHIGISCLQVTAGAKVQLVIPDSLPHIDAVLAMSGLEPPSGRTKASRQVRAGYIALTDVMDRAMYPASDHPVAFSVTVCSSAVGDSTLDSAL